MAAKKARKKSKKKKVGKKASKAQKKPNALDFCRAYLRRSPKATYAQIRDAAKKKRLTLYPISYGRAQALEGIVKSKPYGSSKKAKKTAAKRGPGRPKGSKNKKRGPGRPKGSKNKRGPGRPRKSSEHLALTSLVDTLKNLQRERNDAIKVLHKIRELVG